MDKKRPQTSSIFWSLCLLILILDSKTAISGAAAGIDLCIRVLIPSIFPFLVICPMVSANIGTCSFLFRHLGKFLRLPVGAEDLFFLGLLSGYPVGANMVSQAVQSKRISKTDGARLLAFCSNAGPSFIFGIGASLFPDVRYCAALWLIHILSAMAVARMTPGAPARAEIANHQIKPFPQVLRGTISTMVSICAWVVLFRIVITITERWFLWVLPVEGQIVLRGVLELANGIVSLAQIVNLGQKMLLFSVLLSFGGICVWMQTLSVTYGVSTRYYLPGKITQSAISALIATAVQIVLPKDQRYWPNLLFLVLCMGICMSYPLFLRKIKNRSRNPDLLGV